MFTTASPLACPAPPSAITPALSLGRDARQRTERRIGETMHLLAEALAPDRQVVREGDKIYQAGDRFEHLYVANSGCFKIVNLAQDGREQFVSLKFRGDWLGFDGIEQGRHACDAVALDTGEVWAIRYQALLAVGARRPVLLTLLHGAMSAAIARQRDLLMAVCTLPADARVAEFLHYWADSLAQRGLRTDRITLRMTRAEIGNGLGLTLETVSRALSRLARENLIAFDEKGRRELRIPDLGALAAFVLRVLSPPVLQ